MQRMFAVLALVLSTLTASADEAADLLKKILAAQAKDAATAKKLETIICKGQGTSQSDDGNVKVQMQRQGIWPGRFKAEFTFTSGEKKIETLACVRDDRGWGVHQGTLYDLSEAQISELRMMGYDCWMGLLVPLRESGPQLTVIPGIKVDGEPTVGLKVTRKAWPDMTLYFDEKTFLLKRQICRRSDQGLTKTFEHTFREYKEIEGIQLPTKMKTMLGPVEAFNFEKLEYTFPATLDKEIFEKPRR